MNLFGKLGTLSFGQDADGNWGYKVAGADSVIPFKSLNFKCIMEIGIAYNTSGWGDCGTKTITIALTHKDGIDSIESSGSGAVPTDGYGTPCTNYRVASYKVVSFEEI